MSASPYFFSVSQQDIDRLKAGIREQTNPLHHRRRHRRDQPSRWCGRRHHTSSNNWKPIFAWKVHRLGLVLSSGASIGRPAVPAVAWLERWAMKTELRHNHYWVVRAMKWLAVYITFQAVGVSDRPFFAPQGLWSNGAQRRVFVRGMNGTLLSA